MATVSKTKKVKGVRQKLKLFRSNDPIKSVLMWGVNYACLQLNHIKPRAMLLSDDFKAYLKVKVNNYLFNKDNMPSRFKFKEYCPLVFQNLRERFGVDQMHFWDSFTKQQPNWDNSKGRSGSKFLLSYNCYYIVKTISSEEVEQVHHMLQTYHEYIVNCFAITKLPHFLAMYRLTVNDQETYMLVMRYVFSPRMQIHTKFDLKGSTIDREASEKEKKNALPTLKDVDFANSHGKIIIGQEEKSKLMEIIERDVGFLQSLNVMDYSLIVGVHDLEKGNSEPPANSSITAPSAAVTTDIFQSSNCVDQSTTGGNPSGSTTLSTFPQPQASMQLQMMAANEMSPAEDDEDFIGFEGDYTNQTPPESPKPGHFPGEPFQGELHPMYEFYAIKSLEAKVKPVIYFIGIIDILTHYGMRKRTAQKYKSVKHGVGAEISTVKPELYGRRFLDFLANCIE